MRAGTLTLAAAAAAAVTAQTTGSLTTTIINNYLFGVGTAVAAVIAASLSPGPTTYLLWCGDDDDQQAPLATTAPRASRWRPGLRPDLRLHAPCRRGVGHGSPSRRPSWRARSRGTTRALYRRWNDIEDYNDGKPTTRTISAMATVEMLTAESVMWGPIIVPAGAEKLQAAAAENGADQATATTAAMNAITGAGSGTESAVQSISEAMASRTGGCCEK